MVTRTKMRSAAEVLYRGSVASEQGQCELFATEKGVCWSGIPGTSQEDGVNWLARRMVIACVIEEGGSEPLRQAMIQLERYVAGEPVQFSCPLDLRGTPFQVSVWQELYRIPYGQTRTYAQIASAIGAPKAVRAVGAANGANPLAVIVPCHRVIGSNGALTGYGGGLDLKAWLLTLERGALGAAKEREGSL